MRLPENELVITRNEKASLASRSPPAPPDPTPVGAGGGEPTLMPVGRIPPRLLSLFFNSFIHTANIS